MEIPNNNQKLTPIQVAAFLENCTDEEFAEVFVAYDKMRKKPSVEHLTKEDMLNFDIQEITTLIGTCLKEIIPKDSEMDTGAWWKRDENKKENSKYAQEEDELDIAITTKDDNKLYMKMWFSSNPPAEPENPGCIGITVYDSHMREIDGGELDYEADNVKLRDKILDCAELMGIDVKSVKETKFLCLINKQEDMERDDMER